MVCDPQNKDSMAGSLPPKVFLVLEKTLNRREHELHGLTGKDAFMIPGLQHIHAVDSKNFRADTWARRGPTGAGFGISLSLCRNKSRNSPEMLASGTSVIGRRITSVLHLAIIGLLPSVAPSPPAFHDLF